MTIKFKETFYKTFNETLNISCKTYILEYRLSKALQDLKSTTLPIAEIAQRNGFNSAIGYRENGITFEFDGAWVSDRLVNSIKPIIGVI